MSKSQRQTLKSSVLILLSGIFIHPFIFANTPTQRPEVATFAQQQQDKLIKWRRDFHQYPELSNREERTATKVTEHLRSLGLEPKTIAHHGVVAIVKGNQPGPKLALRADMDALPITEQTGLPFASQVTALYRGQTVGVMHACGHDAHTSILMGVAEALVMMQHELPGQVMLIFQPAEEGAPEGEKGGASFMLEEGIFKDFTPDAVFGLHMFPSLRVGQIAVRKGPTLTAADSFSITISGHQTHAATPWKGIDPIVASADMISTVQSIISRRTNISKLPAVISFGAINGGIRHNIIPNEVEMLGTIRTFDTNMREQIFTDLKRVVEHTAAAHGAHANIKIPDQPGLPATINDPELTTLMLPSLQAVVGKDNVLEPPLQMVADDFSFFAQHVPSMFFFVGSTDKNIDVSTAPNTHSPNFLLDETALDVGFRALLQATLDYLHNADKPFVSEQQ